MVKYLMKRLLLGIVSLWVIITFTFILMNAIPGGPFDPTGLETMSEVAKQNQIRKYGLDKPYYEQYFIYIKNLLKGDLGTSITYSPRTVEEIIGRQLPVTAKLGAVGVVVVLVVGIVWGIIAALNQDKWQDTFMRIVTPFAITIPRFVLATVLIYLFAVRLKWFPTMNLKGPEYYVLPVVAMVGSSIAYLARLTRSSLLDVIRHDYIRTAKAKGLSKSKIIYKHALRNGMLPVITFTGPVIVGMLTGGSLIIEKIFAIPGIGREMVAAIGNRDYYLILGLTTFYSIIMILTYIIVDIFYAIIDPRIRFDK
jgi:oligopeptide transport system permease protein